MSKRKSSKSIHFVDIDNVSRFLFQVVTISNDSDYLKFAFNSPQSTKLIYTEQGFTYTDDSLLRSFGEISYKPDGALLIKFPKNSKDPKTIYDNPDGEGARRKPLKEIQDWEPVFIGKIIRYQDCIVNKTDDVVELLRNDELFNGDPFQYIVYLGNSSNSHVPNGVQNSVPLRLSKITDELDLFISVSKSVCSGFPFAFGNIKGWNSNNVVQVIDPLTGKTTNHLLNIAIYRTAAKITPYAGNINNEESNLTLSKTIKVTWDRSNIVTRATPDPYKLNTYSVSGGYMIEVRSRSGVWFPFSIGVPLDEKEKVGSHNPVFLVGDPDQPLIPSGTSILVWDSVSEGADRDGKRWWIINPAVEITPEKSFYLFVREIPSIIAFGPRKGPQYTYKLLPLERPPIPT